MKSHALTALAAFVFGVAITLGSQWLGGEPREEDSAPPSKSTARTPASTSTVGGVPGHAPKSAGKAMGEELSAEDKAEKKKLAALKERKTQGFDVEKWRASMMERMESDGQKQIEARLALWTEKLGLSKAQVAALRSIMEERLQERITKAGEAEIGDFKAFAYGKRGSGDAELAELLDEVLTEEQRDRYAGLQEEQRQVEIESRAMRRLADLQTHLDMTGEQRDRVFEVLHEQESAGGGARANPKEQYQAFMDEGGSTEGWREHYTELQRVAREEQLEQVSGILSERQLNLYRDFLERRGGAAKISSGVRLRTDVSK